MNSIKSIKIVLLTALISGCHGPSLYQWASYDERLYEYYHDPVSAEAFPALLEAHVQQAESNQVRVAPGLYAEVGTFKLITGNIESAIGYYQKESATWPESSAFMNSLVENLKRLQSEKKEQDNGS